MKKITMFCVAMLCSFGMVIAQTPAELAEIQASDAIPNSATIDIQELLDRKAAIGNSIMPMSHYFSAEEMYQLQLYFRNGNRLADIIPTAGATETFAVTAGDNFFDPGGPGGSSTGGTPGNYPNCACTTLTTITGVEDINFAFFSVFSSFDWLRLYDGADTSGTLLFDNSAGGAQSGVITEGDMAAATGTMFTSTTGSFTFEFFATGVVDYGGWDVEILSSSGPADFYVKDGFPGTDFGTMPQPGPYTISPIAAIPESLFLDDIAADGLLYAIDVNSLNLVTVDLDTGAQTIIGNTGMTNFPTGLSYNFFNGTMYAIDTDITITQLYSIDLTTGAATAIGTPVANAGIWMEIDNDGNAYMADLVDDNLYTIDLDTGVTTLIGPLGIDLNFAQDATYDHDNNILYGGLYDGLVTNISTIDVTTGTATVLGTGNFEAVMLSLEGGTLSNNVCAGAVAVDCGDTIGGDTSDATDNGGANASPDEWYSFTGSGFEELITVSLCDGGTAYDSLLTIYDSCGGTVVADNDDSCDLQSEVTFTSDGTSTYYIAVEGFGTNSGAYSLALTCVVPQDFCDIAAPLTCGTTVSGSTSNATSDEAVAANCEDTFDPTPFNPTVDVTAPGIWYSYTEASIPGLITDVTLDLCDAATYDTKISVYTGDCGALTCVAANDDNDDCSGFTSTVEFQSDGVSTYYILVHGFGTASGDFDLTISCTPVAPPNDMIENSIDVDEIGFPYTDPAVNMPGATLEAGTPAECDNAGVAGVWYNFVPEMGGTATATAVSPAGYTSVTFYSADSEDAVETDLTLVDWFDNQCVPGADASIPVVAGQAYYVYVANTMGVTDIVIDGDFFLGVGDGEIVGFNYYPNPADNLLNLSAAGNIESATIYNILGQEVLSRTFNTNNAQVDVSNLSVGAYVMKVMVDGELGVYKIVKK